MVYALKDQMFEYIAITISPLLLLWRPQPSRTPDYPAISISHTGGNYYHYTITISPLKL